MANLLTVENICKSVGDRTLFTDISFGVDEGEKIGIIARNGTGKSTLLSIMAGVQNADSGNIVTRNGLRIGYLPQEPVFADNATVASSVLDSEDPVAKIVRSYSAASACGDPDMLHEAIQAMDAASAWSYQDRIGQILTRFGLPDGEQPVSELSGGQRKRLALARIVIQEADLLLLDEPTNHLDISTIEWLESFLNRSRATLLMVTHDRYFLDRVCNRILELDRQSIFSVSGDYDTYLRRRAERIEAMDAELARVRNTLRREQDWMSRQPQARGGKAKFRIDAYNDMLSRSHVSTTERNITLETKSSRIGSKIFEAKNICKRFGDKVILDDFSYTFAPGEKIGIVGPNGIGKSTFIKMLQGLLPVDSGEWNVGETVRFGYYSQDGMSFDTSKKVIDAIQEIAEDISLSQDRHIAPMQYLQRFLFSPADQQKYIYKLSGGERCRLHLAVVLMSQPNFLILDEPTNDLDIVTLGILEEYLADFKGCAIIVSHDRFFLDSIVDHLFVMEGNGIVRDFPGNYSDYRTWKDENRKLQDKKDQPKKTAVHAENRAQRSDRPAKLSFKERLEMENLSVEIDKLSEEKKALEAFFSSGECNADFDERAARYRHLCDELDEKEMRWLELSEKA